MTSVEPRLTAAIARMLAAGALLTAISFVNSTATTAADAPPDVSQGDGGVSSFYVWPGDISGVPGRMLRQEPLAGSLLLLDNAAEGRRILYTSIDGIDGTSPMTVSGAVFFPRGTAPSGGWPVIAWAHGTVGIADVCAPSWVGRWQRDVDYLNVWLAEGYAIVATDYQGLGTPGVHPYMAARPEAYSVLDGLRAALHEYPLLANSVVIVGQSQGAHAAIAAAGLASSYAPEIAVRGIVATGAPFFRSQQPLSSTVRSDKVDSTVAYPLLLLYLAQRVRPPFAWADYVTDRAMPTVLRARTECLPEIMRSVWVAGLTRDNSFKMGVPALIAEMLPYMMYPTLKVDPPVFIGTGTADHDVDPTATQYPLVKAACAAGSVIEHHYYPGRDHSDALMASLVDAKRFAKKVFAGEPVVSNCASVQPPLATGN
jgi:acetyl esterase/lipase